MNESFDIFELLERSFEVLNRTDVVGSSKSTLDFSSSSSLVGYLKLASPSIQGNLSSS